MFSLIKQVLIILFSFSSSLATKRVSLNDEPWMIRPTPIDLNPVELKYYQFMIILDRCDGSCNVQCCIYNVVFVIILPLIITIICYRYAKHRSKQKVIDALTM